MVMQNLTKNISNFIIELKKKEKQEESGFSFAEGKNILVSCLQKNIPIKYIILDKAKKEFFKDILKKVDNSVIFWTDEQNLLRISSTKTPYFCITVFMIPEIIDTIDEKTIDSKNFSSLLNEIESYLNNEKFISGFFQISDPGNLGTIIRTSVGFNQTNIILFEPHCDLFSPKVVRSTSGAIFSLKKVINVSENLEEKFLAKIKKLDLKIAFAESSFKGSDSKGNIDIQKGNINIKENIIKPLPVLVLYGNEGKGIPEKLQNVKDYSISIPQSNDIESYNLSISHAIITYSLYQQTINNTFTKY
jgi:tRNA G18 (ribose-2'-O)-methylase SpoU